MGGFLLRHGVAWVIVGLGVYAYWIRDDLADLWPGSAHSVQVQRPLERHLPIEERSVSRQDVRETRPAPTAAVVKTWSDPPQWPPRNDGGLRAQRPTTLPRRPNREDRRLAVQEARSAFWQGDMKGAESRYLDLTARFPGDPDILGELGNLYFLQGLKGKYLDAYFQAVLGLLRAQRRDEARELIDVIAREDTERAALLRRNLEGA